MIESIQKNKKGILMMLCSAVLVSFGQMYLKVYRMEDASGFVPHGLAALALGFFLYVVGALIMIYAYRFGRLSVLQPVLSVGYVLAIFIGVFFLGEQMTPARVGGILVIVFGVILIGGGDADDGPRPEIHSGRQDAAPTIMRQDAAPTIMRQDAAPTTQESGPEPDIGSGDAP
ncbi:MAG: DMT family transporter [Clostridiales Family XIII bacterium]|jgi:undecaprenyl phosphate-alpha-L-ara4N flippase subunit ArnE|nr:DMT family transporter [Clostridiales Family XIII bacterium]